MTARTRLSFDDTLARRLSLPLAQLYRRAHNAKTALERHQTAYYLWEASLRLLSSASIVELAESGVRDEDLALRLQSLARPSLGHWWEFTRRLVPLLAEASGGDPGYARIRNLVLGKARDDLPRAAGLDAALCASLGAGTGARTTVRVSELFDRLVQYRNREIGHGAAGQRAAGYYEDMGQALLAGVGELLGVLDPLAGRELIFISDIRRHASGQWLVERYRLAGETAQRLETLEIEDDDTRALPHPSRVYLQGAGAGAEEPLRLRSLHPLVLFDADHAEIFFLNARRGHQGSEYLSYSSGRVVRCEELVRDHRELLSRILGMPVEESHVETWAARSRAEDASTPVDVDARPLQRIGEFEILSRIGRGGMGVVYRAWQPSLGRQVALKCLLSAGDPRVEARFAREIRSLARVEHPGLVKIYTSGSDGDRWFYAMELIEGADLARVTDRLGGSKASTLGPSDWKRAISSACSEARESEEVVSPSPGGTLLPELAADDGPDSRATVRSVTGAATEREVVDSIVDIVRQVAEAAHVLHEAGIIHRDIKPGNIMVTAEGKDAVLMDLGLAQLADDTQGRLTMTRNFVGTLRYASPEQVLAVVPLDRRTDVYSLGATLWELLTLRPLFDAAEDTPTPDLMIRIQSQDPERPSRHNPRVPSDLDAIVLKCLEKDPARRYDSARGLAEDLARWRRGDAVHAQPQTLAYILSKYVRRYRVRIAVAALLALSFLAVAVVSTIRIHLAHEASQLALSDNYTSSGHRAADDGNPAEAFFWYARASTVLHGDEYRRAADSIRLASSLARLAIPVRAFEQAGSHVEILELRRDSSMLLTRDRDGRCRIWSLDEEREVDLPCLEQRTSAARWSPDGERLVLGRPSGAVEVRDVPGGRELHRLTAGDGPVRVLEFSPGGRFLAIGGDGLRIWNCETSEFVGAATGHPAPVVFLRFCPRGERILSACEDDKARVFAIDGGGETRPAELGSFEHWVHFNIPGLSSSERPWRPLLVNDGRDLLTVTSPTEVAWWDIETGERKQTITTRDRLLSLELSPDGRFLAVVDSHQAQVWNVAAGQVEGDPIESGGLVVWKPDSSGLFHGSGSIIREYHIPLEERYRESFLSLAEGVAIPCLGGIRGFTMSRDGRLLAAADAGGLVRVWSLEFEDRRGFVYPSLVLTDSPTSLIACDEESGRFFPLEQSSLRPVRSTRVGDLTGEMPAGPLLTAEGELEGGGFSPGFRRVHTLSRVDETRVLEVWDWRSGVRRSRTVLPANIRAAVHGDESLAIRLDNDRILTIDAGSGAVLSDVPCPPGDGFAFGRAAETFVVWGPGAPSFWSTRTGERIAFSLADRPDCSRLWLMDDRIVTATPSNVVHVWDEASGRRLSAPLRHERPVSRVALLPGSLLTWDGKLVSLWNLPDGRRIRATALPSPPAFLGHRPWFTTSDGASGLLLWDAASGSQLFRIWGAAPNTAVLLPPTEESLAGLIEPRVPSLPRATPSSLLRLAELLSGETSQVGVLGDVSRAEWLERWNDVRREFPDLLVLDTSRRARNAWHRQQAAEHDRRLQWNAAEWHLAALGAAQTAEDRERHRRMLSYVRSWRFTRQARFWKPAYEAARRALHSVDILAISLDTLDEAALETIADEARQRPLARSRGPYVHFPGQYPHSLAISLGYCLRVIRTPEPRTVRVFAGSDDTLRVWLDAREVFRSEELGPAIVDYHAFDLALDAGENILLVEVGQSGGDWGLFLRLEDLEGKRLHLNDDGRLETLD